MKIIQGFRPSGIQCPTEVDLSPEAEGKATAAAERGWSFYAEMVQPGIVFLSAERGEDEVLTRIVPNGPKIITALEELVEAAK